VPLRQRNLAASARAIAEGYGLGADDCSYCVMPLFHVHGLVASTLAALAAGGSVVVPRRTRPGALWPHVHEHGVTWFSAVPTILAKLPAAPDEGHGSLRFARSCSSSLAPPLWAALEQRFGVPVVEAYGMTEASHQMASNPLPPGDRRPGTVGLPAGAEVAVVDEDWRPVPAGTAGEVAVRGSGVVDGYLDNPEANSASFHDGWFRTGDVGRLSADGYLTLEGRLKELINRGGEKIAPREVDEALLSHPRVREAVAYGVPDAKWGEVVHAAVVVDDALSPDELRAFCSDRLAAFKVPRRVHIVAEIPKGPTGKIQRRVLAEALEA
jgi:oxalate---CoA ligase